MRVIRENSLDLGFVMTALLMGAVGRGEVESWAARVIDEVPDPPLYIYSMLDLAENGGNALRREIGFTPSDGVTCEDEFQYLREISVRRHHNDYHFLAGKPRASLPSDRKDFIDGMMKRNFDVDVSVLPPL